MLVRVLKIAMVRIIDKKYRKWSMPQVSAAIYIYVYMYINICICIYVYKHKSWDKPTKTANFSAN